MSVLDTIFLSILFLILTIFICLCFINPGAQTIKTLLLYSLLLVFMSVKQEYIIYITCFTLYFSYYLRYLGSTTNGIICISVFTLLLRSVIEKQSIISMKLIKKNPFILPSFILLICYLISFARVYKSTSSSLVEYHFTFISGIIFVFIFSYLIIGFVNTKERIIALLQILIAMLVLNLLFGLITLIFPSFTLLSGYLESKTLEVGVGSDKAIRLGGITFHYEAYAEYLMMAIVFGTALLMKIKLQFNKLFFCLILLLLCSIELLLTNTRGALITVLIGILLPIVFNKNSSLGKKIYILLVVVICGISVTFIAEITGMLKIVERFSSFGGSDSNAMSVSNRDIVWARAIAKIMQDKYLGSGPSFYPSTTYVLKFDDPTLPLWPHNLFLLIIATIGIYGLIAYLFLFIKMIVLWVKVKNIADNYVKYFYYSLGIALLMFLIDAQKYDGFLRETVSYFYFMWFLIAFFFSANNFISLKSTENR